MLLDGAAIVVVVLLVLLVVVLLELLVVLLLAVDVDSAALPAVAVPATWVAVLLVPPANNSLTLSVAFTGPGVV